MAIEGRRRSDEVWEKITIADIEFENDPNSQGAKFSFDRKNFILGVNGGNTDRLAVIITSRDQTEYDGFRWVNNSIASIYVNTFELYTSSIAAISDNQLALNPGTISTIGSVDSGSTLNWFDDNIATQARMTSALAGVEKTDMVAFSPNKFRVILDVASSQDCDFDLRAYDGSSWTAIEIDSIETSDPNVTATNNTTSFNLAGSVATSNDCEVTISVSLSQTYVGWSFRRTAVNAGSALQNVQEFQAFFDATTYDQVANVSASVNQLHKGYAKITSDVTGDSTLDKNNFIVPVDATSAAITITLPAVADILDGKKYIIKKIDSSVNAVTIDGDGSEEIEGATTQALSNQWEFIEIVSTGSAWLIIGDNR
jgi:hypothetical protein